MSISLPIDCATLKPSFRNNKSAHIEYSKCALYVHLEKFSVGFLYDASLMKTFFALLIMLCTSQFLRAEPTTLRTSSGVLYGTLELPRCKTGKNPVALLIAGSGATDRNGNTLSLGGANNSLQYLAESLASRGIASLRFDKRGIGQSAKAIANESTLRFGTYVDDVVLWAKQLRRDKRFSTLTIVGHSEGSLIALIAARKIRADACISVAGIGRPASQVLLQQLKSQLSPELFAQAQAIVGSLEKGKPVETTPLELQTLFRPSVQPYLVSWFALDASREIKKLTIPVLIAQGTTDIQVNVTDAKLLKAAQPKAQLLVINGMNHVLKSVPNDRAAQIASYTDATLPVANELVDGIARFIRSVKSTRK